MVAQTPMELLGYDGERPVYFAKPGTFVAPGIYRWNGTDHDLVLSLEDAPTNPIAGLGQTVADAEKEKRERDAAEPEA